MYLLVHTCCVFNVCIIIYFFKRCLLYYSVLDFVSVLKTMKTQEGIYIMLHHEHLLSFLPLTEDDVYMYVPERRLSVSVYYCIDFTYL